LADNDENCETLNGKCWEGHCSSEWISDVCNRFMSSKKKNLFIKNNTY
jgi:hypothetical protein